jgi:hypothetical protein
MIIICVKIINHTLHDLILLIFEGRVPLTKSEFAGNLNFKTLDSRIAITSKTIAIILVSF